MIIMNFKQFFSFKFFTYYKQLDFLHELVIFLKLPKRPLLLSWNFHNYSLKTGPQPKTARHLKACSICLVLPLVRGIFCSSLWLLFICTLVSFKSKAWHWCYKECICFFQDYSSASFNSLCPETILREYRKWNETILTHSIVKVCV